MELLEFLLGISLIFITIKTATSNCYPRDELSSYRINKSGIQLIDQNITLIPYVSEDDYKNINISKNFKSYIDKERAKGNLIFYGESNILFREVNKISNIDLHFGNLKIDEEESKIVITYDHFNRVIKLNPFYLPQKETIKINLEELSKDLDFYIYRLIIKFIGSINDNTGGFFKTSYKNSKGNKTWLIAAANFPGTGARQIFPCWDEPDIRINFTISIKHHRNYIALSNSPIKEELTDDDGMIWTHFKTTDKISPYQVAIILSELNHVPNTNVWCRKDVEQQLKFAQEIANNATSYLKRIFNTTKFPSKVDHVIIPGFRDDGLESWGLVLHRETAVMYDEKLDFVAEKFEVARMVARKMVHQLFGNLVGQTWWSHLWLNEGIASFLAMEIIKEFVHSDLMDLLIVQFQHESLRLDDYYYMPLVSDVITPFEVESLFSFTYYVKAPVFVRTLLQVISIDAFKISLNRYLTTYQVKSIDISTSTTDKFFNILQGVVKELRELNTSLSEKLCHWTRKEYYPVLQVTRDSPRSVRVTLLRFNESYPKNLFVRVTYITQRNLNVTKKRWLSSKNPSLNLTKVNKNDWIIVNVQQAGYYRVNYDNDNWQKLIKYLNSAKYYNIHVLNRAQIINDAYYFLLNNKLNVHFFKNLTYYLSNENNYVAWYPMFKIMEEISGFFPFSESTEIKEHLQKILISILGEIGFTKIVENSDEDAFKKCLRQEAAKWACILNSEHCMNSAFFKLKHRTKSISPGWKEWTYCKGLMSADYNYWLKVSLTEKIDNNLLKYLACIKNHTVIFRYIYLLKSEFFIEAEHCVTIFHSIIARHARNDLVLDYILNDLANIIPREIQTIVAFVDIINHVYTRNQLSKIYDFAQFFFSKKIFSYIVEKINIRTSEINKHVSYFTSFLNTE